jgi:hypothetical protein
MIVSHKHKFIFIKTEKTAGTSIEIALSKDCGPLDIITRITKEDEQARKALNHRSAQNYLIPYAKYTKLDWAKLLYTRKRVTFYNHMSSLQVRQYVGSEIWNSYFKFCFERNPWDKMISWYYHWCTREKVTMSFEKFLNDGMASKLKGFDLYTNGGIQIVDRVFKYENMQESLDEISSILGLPEKVRLPEYRAKGGMRPENKKYQDIISTREADLIAKIYAREISYFGYSF